jgi:hypothetical protein
LVLRRRHDRLTKNEAKSAPRQSLNVFWVFGFVAQGLAELFHRRADAVIEFDYRVFGP